MMYVGDYVEFNYYNIHIIKSHIFSIINYKHKFGYKGIHCQDNKLATNIFTEYDSFKKIIC